MYNYKYAVSHGPLHDYNNNVDALMHVYVHLIMQVNHTVVTVVKLTMKTENDVFSCLKYLHMQVPKLVFTYTTYCLIFCVSLFQYHNIIVHTK